MRKMSRRDVLASLADLEERAECQIKSLQNESCEVDVWLTLMREILTAAEINHQQQKDDQRAMLEVQLAVEVGLACMAEHGVPIAAASASNKSWKKVGLKVGRWLLLLILGLIALAHWVIVVAYVVGCAKAFTATPIATDVLSKTTPGGVYALVVLLLSGWGIWRLSGADQGKPSTASRLVSTCSIPAQNNASAS